MIYKECFRFIKLSNNIETIYSPFHEENVFLLVLFYKGMQWHYEVKMVKKEEKNIYNNKMLINNRNFWLISKCKYDLNEKAFEILFDFVVDLGRKAGALVVHGGEHAKKPETRIGLFHD